MKTREVTIKRIFVDQKGIAIVVCDGCGRTKKISKVDSKMMVKPILVSCPCGNSFRVMFDARRHYRKPVNLRGTFRIVGDERLYPMIVENISFSGLGFRSPFVDNLKLGDKIEVHFRLDDIQNSLIERVAIVRHLSGHFAGAEFVEDRAYDKIINFYLRQ
ncbi:MAG: PilZ domain-containing protein [Syntrophobacterales bacterium]|nr:PilZ domain-containing protein [Syntrophobacterales bacterium]